MTKADSEYHTSDQYLSEKDHFEARLINDFNCKKLSDTELQKELDAHSKLLLNSLLGEKLLTTPWLSCTPREENDMDSQWGSESDPAFPDNTEKHLLFNRGASESGVLNAIPFIMPVLLFSLDHLNIKGKTGYDSYALLHHLPVGLGASYYYLTRQQSYEERVSSGFQPEGSGDTIIPLMSLGYAIYEFIDSVINRSPEYLFHSSFLIAGISSAHYYGMISMVTDGLSMELSSIALHYYHKHKGTSNFNRYTVVYFISRYGMYGHISYSIVNAFLTNNDYEHYPLLTGVTHPLRIIKVSERGHCSVALIPSFKVRNISY
ncbi:hypothetical protein GZ77_01730 [Endozoicomonas montiporae]|uniref:Uncharacterized protein n=2 Tax=Endozoicomonas montiporae TaxID=1027273 RepID=A0A081NAC1_9GAMM|nr:hypothetical protein [Endozoicomonas montiporae]KEQ15394.1 hypothetical protein GZ77_01730 [Endozoicomonas montiporae]